MAKIRVGRSSNNEFVLKDTTVSRNHAEIEDIGGGRYRLTDVGSSAGTFIDQDGKWSQITSVEISADTRVRFGEAEVTLADIVSIEPATAVPGAGAGDSGSGLGQRAESGAAEMSVQGGARRGAGGGAGWAGLSPNFKIGILVGGGVFVLLIVAAIVVGLVSGGGTTAGGGAITGGGRVTGGGVSGSAAKARLQQAMLASCTKRGQKQEVCRCVAKNIVAGISDADAKVLIDAQRNGKKPPKSLMRKFLTSAFAAGRSCAKR
ncbi:MAG: FHA domain-containing protein [Alphaproteobacteria bacterium]